MSLHLGWGLHSPLGFLPRGEASGQAALTLPGTCRDPSHFVWAGCCQDQTSGGGGWGEGGLLEGKEHCFFLKWSVYTLL